MSVINSEIVHVAHLLSHLRLLTSSLDVVIMYIYSNVYCPMPMMADPLN